MATEDAAWDDAAFKQRVREAAEKKGMRPREALVQAGVSPGYLDKSGLGRATDVIQRLAQILDVTPAYLAGWSEPPQKTEDKLVEKPPFACANGFTAHEKLVRISVYTKIIAAQLATLSTLAYSASTGSELEAQTLANLLKSVIAQLDIPKAEREGNGG